MKSWLKTVQHRIVMTYTRRCIDIYYTLCHHSWKDIITNDKVNSVASNMRTSERNIRQTKIMLSTEFSKALGVRMILIIHMSVKVTAYQKLMFWKNQFRYKRRELFNKSRKLNCISSIQWDNLQFLAREIWHTA